jgi:hypothetical protein
MMFLFLEVEEEEEMVREELEVEVPEHSSFYLNQCHLEPAV